MRHLRIALLTAAALAASAAPAAAAPQTPAAEQAPFSVDAHGDAIAWSSFDPVTKQYQLRIRRNGAVTSPPVAGRGRAFDVDLGPLPGGGLGAVYSRCADDVARTGCDLYLLDVGAG